MKTSIIGTVKLSMSYFFELCHRVFETHSVSTEEEIEFFYIFIYNMTKEGVKESFKIGLNDYLVFTDLTEYQ